MVTLAHMDGDKKADVVRKSQANGRERQVVRQIVMEMLNVIIGGRWVLIYMG
tara:strand:- start:372 stop:527 length:156 start_codon:yes stop_codon:yes gene_type:complete